MADGPVSVTLTAEQAVLVARWAAEAAANRGEALDAAWADPDEVRRLHREITPYVGLIRELQEELAVTRLGTLREVAEDVRRNAHQAVTFEHNTLLKLRGGDTDWGYAGMSVDESAQVTLEQMDERLVEASVAGAVLELVGDADEGAHP